MLVVVLVLLRRRLYSPFRLLRFWWRLVALLLHHHGNEGNLLLVEGGRLIFVVVDFNRFRGAFLNRFRLRKMHQQRVETKREVGVPSDADREQLLRSVHDSIERGKVSENVETEESGEKV